MYRKVIVFQASANLQEKMITYYADKKRKKVVPYSLFHAEEKYTIITLYQSGKVVFQGANADTLANYWIDLEKNLTGKIIKIIEKEKNSKDFYNYDTIGSDEVGTGDYFGPIVVTASFVSKKKAQELKALGVKDSKKIPDDKIKILGPILIKEIPYCSCLLDNKTYNQFIAKGYNINEIKAILHNKVLLTIKNRYPKCQDIVIDEFVYKEKYYEYLVNAKEKLIGINFIKRAENVCPAVAVSSIISRFIFLNEMAKISKKIGIKLYKGANKKVDEQGVNLVMKNGWDILQDIAKINFKNTEKIKTKSIKNHYQ